MAELELHSPTEQRTLRLSAPGQTAVIPAGTWHRVVVHTPSRLLFITPTPARTEHREAEA